MRELSHLASFYVQGDNLWRAFAFGLLEGIYDARVQHPQDFLRIQVDVHDVLQCGTRSLFLEGPAREREEIGLAVLVLQRHSGQGCWHARLKSKEYRNRIKKRFKQIYL